MTLHDFFYQLDFISPIYYVFVFFAVFVFWMLKGKSRIIVLGLASLLFYLTYSIWALLYILWFIFSSWIGAKFIAKKKKRSILIINILLIIIPFIAIRVFNTCLSLGIDGILLSGNAGVLNYMSFIGVSYAVCMAISYIIDIYRGDYSCVGFVDYLVYLSFFPLAIAGPIERTKNIVPQLKKIERSEFDYFKFESGLVLILYGLFAKLVVADRVGILVKNVLDNYQRYLGMELVLAIVLYGVQLYCDFMACSKIAKGLAKLFGINITNNFEQPYFSRTISVFWKRWHISLSTWLRDYIYIPLGGNRKGKYREYFNLILTFIVSGLWHGFSLNYIFWGMLHAIYQIVGRITAKFRNKINDILKIDINTIGVKLFDTVVVFVLVDFAWLFFRMSNLKEVGIVCRNIVYGMNLSFFVDGYLNLGLDVKEWVVFLCGIILITLVDVAHIKNNGNIENVYRKEFIVFRFLFMAGLFASILLFGVYGSGIDPQTFIYRGF